MAIPERRLAWSPPWRGSLREAIGAVFRRRKPTPVPFWKYGGGDPHEKTDLNFRQKPIKHVIFHVPIQRYLIIFALSGILELNTLCNEVKGNSSLTTNRK